VISKYFNFYYISDTFIDVNLLYIVLFTGRLIIYVYEYTRVALQRWTSKAVRASLGSTQRPF